MSAHWYNKDGDLVPAWTKGAYPSPSTILDRIKSDEYMAMVRREGIEGADEIMRKAAARGTRIHKACELWANGNEDFAAELEEQDHAYVSGFVKWWQEYEPTLVHTELFVRSPKYKFAGRLDLLVKLGGQMWIIDIKTGQDSVRHGLQLRFYGQAVRETYGVLPRMGVLALDAKRACGYRNSKSPYGLQEYNEPLAAIRAHRDVFRWWDRKKPAVKPVDGSLIWKGKVPV